MLLHEWVQGRCFFLLAALLALFMLYPFWVGNIVGLTVLDLLSWVILVAGVWAIRHNRKLLLGATFIAVSVFAVDLLSYWQPNASLILLSFGLEFAFFVLLFVLVLFHVMETGIVTADKLFGAISAYLLLGLIWALLFSIFEVVHPGSFQARELALSELSNAADYLRHVAIFDQLVFYSFVTQTTLGYGDIIPVSPPARMFSILAAVAGQLYLAILVARLVTLQLTQNGDGK